jgi:hypothetical protein
MNRDESAESATSETWEFDGSPVPAPSEGDLKQIADTVARALAAWDLYTIEGRLPQDSHWLDQGSHWDDFNSGHLGAQERPDPAIARAAWNTLERALLKLSNLTARLREHWGLSTPVLPFQDRRMGSFSRASGRRTEMTKPIARKASAA